MFLDGLDELDRKIVGLLIQNARMSYSDIGQQVGISRAAVKMRVQALEKKGIIEEYTTIINPQKLGGAVSCYFEIETAPESLSEVAEILRQNDTVTGSPAGASSMSTRLPRRGRRWNGWSAGRLTSSPGSPPAAATLSFPGLRISRGCGCELPGAGEGSLMFFISKP